MGIRFIYGRAGTGKSSYCIEEIKRKVNKSAEDNKLIYIVPEQYTFQRETLLLRKVTERALLRTEVLSFKRMAYRVFEECGGRVHERVKGSGKNMLIHKIFQENEGDLKYFNKMAKEQGFIDIVSKTITEFKKYKITPQALADKSEDIEEDELNEKLKDLSLIYEKYNNSIEENMMDIDDELTMLSEKLANCNIYDDAEVWLDEFTTFTPQQLEVIKILAKRCKTVNITLCMDSIGEKNKSDEFTDIFNSTKKTESMILNIMKSENINYLEPINLNENEDNRFKYSKELSHLEKNFYTYPFKRYEDNINDIRLYKANNSYDEIETVAKEILSLVRDKGYRYKDISVVCRNIDSYEKIASVIFNEYEIPYFLDKKIDILSNPLVVLILSAIEVYIKNWSYESVFKYLKSGLTGVCRDEIDILENHVLEWGIRGYKWTGELIEDEENNTINDIMKKVREPLIRLQKTISKKSSVETICRAIYEFLVELNVFNRVDEWIQNFEEKALEDKVKEYNQILKVVIDILDQAVETIGNEKVEIFEFYKILNSGFESQEIGVIPLSVDQVNIGDIARIKGRDVKALFIIGVNDGVLPSHNKEEGILSDRDRDILLSGGIEIASTTKSKVFEEQFMVYTALNLAQNFLMISYSMADFEGKSLRPSIVIPRLKNIFKTLEEESALYNLRERNDKYYNISAPNPTFNELILALRKEYEEESIEEYWNDVYSWYSSNNGFKDKIGHVMDGVKYTNLKNEIPRNIIKSLYSTDKGNLLFSVSRLEKYAECPFSYFIKYGLRAKDRKVQEFTAPDLGSFMHDILDDFTNKIKGEGISWNELDISKCRVIVGELVNTKLKEDSNSILNSNKRYKYFTERFKRVISKAVSIISEQMKVSEFEVFSNEFVFGKFDDGAPIKISLPSGEDVYLTGRIDRIDKLEMDEKTYIRIVDYKTGAKKFDLNELYHGIQIQLLVYLDAILKNSKYILKNQAIPGAILYFKIEDPIIKSQTELEDEKIREEVMKKLKMNGLLLKDAKLVRAMDNNISKYSLIIPASIKNDGEFGANSSVITEEQFNLLREYVNNKMIELCEEMLSGTIKIEPCKTERGTYCKYCNYSSICQFDIGIPYNKYKVINKKNDTELWQQIKKVVEVGEDNGQD